MRSFFKFLKLSSINFFHSEQTDRISIRWLSGTLRKKWRWQSSVKSENVVADGLQWIAIPMSIRSGIAIFDDDAHPEVIRIRWWWLNLVSLCWFHWIEGKFTGYWCCRPTFVEERLDFQQRAACCTAFAQCRWTPTSIAMLRKKRVRAICSQIMQWFTLNAFCKRSIKNVIFQKNRFNITYKKKVTRLII